MSPEARALMAEALAAPRPDLTGDPVLIRAETAAACAPVSTAAIERWQVDVSEIEIAGVPCQRIAPGRGAEPDRRILYFFGGGFMQGSPQDDLPITAALSAQTGAEVIAPYYPLAPEHPYPAALNTCTALARALLTEAPRLCLVGESAGGNLALAVTHRLRHDLRPLALALLSPAADLADKGDSFEADRDPFLKAEDTDIYLRAYLGNAAAATHPGVSPLRGDFDPYFPPVMITTGTRDLLLSTCTRLDERLRNAGISTALRVYDGMWHVFEYYPIPEAEQSLSNMAQFLKKRFEGWISATFT